ncbi:lanthionine synthetase LanC family protein [uncultured Kordia sp.]|uniref:lanthionine synthetase LanC family protein n=1 Tax=uncultured Kordia sp. TaxID=507699 RepID=UPI002629B95E|nr:lanthionine synthetase LanC family protein [uncultured Kordia sp.]
MREKIHQHLQSIDFFIQSYQNDSVTINGGLPGIIIFYFQLHQVTKDEQHYDKAIHFLEILYDKLETEMPTSYLYSEGLGGIGWFLNYIQNFITIDNAFDTPEYDTMFFHVATSEFKRGNYEFLNGFSGILLYLLNKKSTDTSLLSAFIDRIHTEIFQLDTPISFFERSDAQHEFPSINLGVSHGMYGFIAVLNKLYTKRINCVKCEAMIRLVIDFTFSHQKDYITQGTFFPNRIGKGITESIHSRLAWCYGDLGILTVLLNSSTVLKDTKLQEVVIELLICTTHRKDLQTTMMNDVWICHGTSGAAHIFQRLYQKTQIDDFKFASNYWYLKTLAQLERSSPQIQQNPTRLGGYARRDMTGFLNGYTGLGLSLLSALQTDFMDWDEMILMS